MNLSLSRKINIAIDGPAGAGKSTIARRVAERLGYIYVDTGAMYRAVTLATMRAQIDLGDDVSLVRMVKSQHIHLLPGPQGQKVFLNGEDVTELIRSSEVTALVSRVSAIEAIREHLVRLQRAMSDSKGIVMDGRDIGTKVMPDAEVKVFLTASVQVRAERSFSELRDKQPNVTVESLMQSIEERDRMDMGRAISPLKQAVGAVVIDSSEQSIEEVVEAIMSLCRNTQGE